MEIDIQSQNNGNVIVQSQEEEKPQIEPPPIEKVIEMEAPTELLDAIHLGNFALINDVPNEDINIIDSKGYSIMHYAVTYNNLEVIKILIKRKGAQIDILSQQKQTPLSIACHYGFMEIVKYLVENGAQLDTQDIYLFTPLFYAIKSQHYSLTLWLVCRGANFHRLSDSNGCSVVHWAAYQNDIKLLRLIKAVGVEITLLDKMGHSPLQRAFHNYGYEAVNHICQQYPDMVMYGSNSGESKSLKYKIKVKIQLQSKIFLKWTILKEKFQKTSLYSLKELLFENYNSFISGVYIFVTVLLIWSLASSVAFTELNKSQFWFIFNMIYMIGILYFGLCSIWFINRTTKHPNDGKRFLDRMPSSKETHKEEEEKKQEQPQDIQTSSILQIQEELTQQRIKPVSWYEMDQLPSWLVGITLKDFLSISYKPVEAFIDKMKSKPKDYLKFADSIHEHKEEINQLILIDDPLWYQGFTIIHIIFFLFETNRFNALHNIDWNRICFTCFQYKPPRTYHCSQTKQCVQDFHCFSQIFQKSINSTNHLLYFTYLTLELIIFGAYVLIFWFQYTTMCHSSLYIFYPFEVAFLIFKEETLSISLIYCTYYMVYLYLLLFWIIESYCIIVNLTYNELLNNGKYRYLYERRLIKNKCYTAWRPRVLNGLLFNIFSYLGNQVKNLRIV